MKQQVMTPTRSRLSNPFTKSSVKLWNADLREAFRSRKNNPNTYLTRFPFPGQRIAFGPFSPEEESLFEENLDLFRSRGWPFLEYFGIFSIALPNRTGKQCKSMYYTSQHLQHPHDATLFSRPLAARRELLQHHAPLIHDAFNSPIAEQISQRVIAWMDGEDPPPETLQLTPPAAAPSQQQQAHTQQKENMKPNEQGNNQNSTSNKTFHPPHPRTTPKSEAGVISSVTATSYPPPQHRVLKKIATATAPRSKNQDTPSNSNSQSKRKVKFTSMIDGNADEDDDDDFMEGSLRSIAKKPTTSLATADSKTNGQQKSNKDIKTNLKTAAKSIAHNLHSKSLHNNAAVKGVQKNPSKHAKRRRITFRDDLGDIVIRYSFHSSGLNDGENAEESKDGEENKMTVLRLDKEKSLLGWGRSVLPYYIHPKMHGSIENQHPSIKNQHPSKYHIKTPDIFSFDFSSLLSLSTRPFIGVIINAPVCLDGDAVGKESRMRSIQQLALMKLQDCMAKDAILCIFATKSSCAQVVNLMSKVWACKYVENLTWVHLNAGCKILKEDSPFLLKSHSTLIMGRRGSSGELELRHQRSTDVVFAPEMENGRYPDAIQEMLETLLPEPSGVGEEGAPRLLEIAFHGAAAPRPGWMTLECVF